LVATASSTKSRNYKTGFRLAQGEKLADIIEDMNEVVEGIRTLETIKALTVHLNITTPIIEIVYRAIFKNMSMDNAIKVLMTYPYAVDVDYI
jgi:glycerol-3-phosphate dehydrogenase (NAD(P)+)